MSAMLMTAAWIMDQALLPVVTVLRLLLSRNASICQQVITGLLSAARITATRLRRGLLTAWKVWFQLFRNPKFTPCCWPVWGLSALPQSAAASHRVNQATSIRLTADCTELPSA